MGIGSTTSNNLPNPEPGRELSRDGFSADLSRNPQTTPVARLSNEIEMPTSVSDRATFGDWYTATVRALQTSVVETVEVALKKIERLTDEQRLKLTGAIRLAADELLVNVTCYGLAGITSDERVAAYLDRENDQALDETFVKRLSDPEIRSRRGAVTLEVFDDRVELTVFDGTKFADFKERWRRADEAILEENLLRKSGRGLFMIQHEGFTAEQAPSGAVTYTLRW